MQKQGGFSIVAVTNQQAAIRVQGHTN
jgi:hypothetical protein